jgi:ketosteroid isomerase-like protein
MIKVIVPVFTAVFFISCYNNTPKDIKSELDVKADMIEADRNFSRLSEEKGMKEAFIEYLDSDGVLLRPNSIPLEGANAIDYISQQNDSAFSMSWEPRGGSVAKSGDFGYTYGTYLMKFKNKDSVARGTYISIWKKHADGKWKYVVDSGNEGLGEP